MIGTAIAYVIIAGMLLLAFTFVTIFLDAGRERVYGAAGFSLVMIFVLLLIALGAAKFAGV